ncbi:MAG: CpsD/CapB family tyrosine-protein kinase, partial [Lachnospiraceae bacterium]
MQKVIINDVDYNFRTKEAFKTLRSNIEFSGNNVRSISVTSCIPNEGKSEVAFELARSMAQNGSSVLLIDADIRKSVMQEHFKSGKVRYGLSNYLVGLCEMDDATCETNEEGFYIMFSGPVTPTPSELLGSEQFAELLHQSLEMYDYVVVDTPPIGSVVDGLIVGRQCNGTVLTVASRQ